MNIRIAAGVLLGLALTCASTSAADDDGLARMTLCRDSWLDLSKTKPALFQTFAEHFRANFSRNGNDPFFVPNAALTVGGLRIVQAFPQSVGMGVGFSVMVEGDFDKTRKAMEGLLGKRLTGCETGEGMRTCELEIAQQRTFMLMAADNLKNRTLVGCYYYYER